MTKRNQYFEGKNVLVTGASGFVGTHLVRRLVELGANVKGVLHEKKLQRPERDVEFITANLTDQDSCQRVCEGIEYIFMTAANSSGAGVMESTPLAHLTPNIVMNARMLEAAYMQGVGKFCFISSNTVYPVTDYPVKEQNVNFEYFEKYFIVGWMKRFSELMCEMYSEKINRPMQTLVVRPGNLYGPFDKFTIKDSKVVPALIRRAVEGQDPFLVWGDGMDIKDFLYIDDFIEGLIIAFQQIDGFQAVNIASGKPVTIREVLKEILEASGRDNVNIVFDKTKPTMIPKRLIDISKIQSTCGWTPKTTLKDGIRHTVDWYRQTYSDRAPEDYTA